MKKVQFLPLMALILGFGLTMTMSSFKKSNAVLLFYGYDETSSTAPWHQVGTSGYECVPSDNICTYSFPDGNPPVNGSTPTPRSAGTAIPDSFGSYELAD